MQRETFCSCGGGCPRCAPVQAKLEIGEPDDEYEEEADRVADQVMRMPDPGIQRQPNCSATGDTTCGEEEQIQPKLEITPLVRWQVEPDKGEAEEEAVIQPSLDGKQTPVVGSDLASRIHSLRGGGSPLPRSARDFFEPRFGQDFGQVRVHTNGEAVNAAASINARAFTFGRDVVFGAGQYTTVTVAGRRLMAHELTHVVQQRGRPSLVLYRVPWTVDAGHYYTDRGGAVARGRELQQMYMSIDVFQREDGNWQVRYRYGVPQPESYPAVDTGLYYSDQAGAERRASHLRAYGFVVEVFQRPDDNWQCRLLRLQRTAPALPTSTGPDAGFYYTARASAERRVEALRLAGFTAEVVERDDGNFQANITALPTYPDSGGAAEQPTEAAEPAEGEAAEGEAAEGEAAEGEAVEGEAAEGEAAESEAAGGEAAEGEAADINERVGSFVTDLNAALTTLRTARLEELRDAAPDDAAAAGVALPTIDVTIAAPDVRTPVEQAALLPGEHPHSWTCRSAHMSGRARHVRLRIDGSVTMHPEADIRSDFGDDFYDDFVEAWNEAMAGNDLRNYEAGEGWAPGDAYHLEMPDRNVSQAMINQCIAEYVRLTREEGGVQNASIEAAYADQIEALLAEEE